MVAPAVTVLGVQGPSRRCLTRAFSGTPGTDTFPPHKEGREGSSSSWGLGCVSQCKGFRFFLAGLAWLGGKPSIRSGKLPQTWSSECGSMRSIRQPTCRIQQATVEQGVLGPVPGKGHWSGQCSAPRWEGEALLGSGSSGIWMVISTWHPSLSLRSRGHPVLSAKTLSG